MNAPNISLRLIATSLLVGSVAFAGPSWAAGPTVKQAAFCITRSETGCYEIALSGTMVDYNRLPKRSDGTRVIAFFSIQQTPANATFVHVLEAEDADSNVDYVLSEANGSKLGDLTKTLKEIATKVHGVGNVVITPFRADAPHNEPYRVFSELPIRGPGVFYGRVVDVKGNPLPGGERITFSVVQSPR